MVFKSLPIGTLIGTQLIGIGAQLIWPGNSVSELLHNVDTYAGIGLFSAMSIYDYHIARERFYKNDPDDLSVATSFYLDFMNVLIRVIEILSKIKKD